MLSWPRRRWHSRSHIPGRQRPLCLGAAWPADRVRARPRAETGPQAPPGWPGPGGGPAGALHTVGRGHGFRGRGVGREGLVLEPRGRSESLSLPLPSLQGSPAGAPGPLGWVGVRLAGAPATPRCGFLACGVGTVVPAPPHRGEVVLEGVTGMWYRAAGAAPHSACAGRLWPPAGGPSRPRAGWAAGPARPGVLQTCSPQPRGPPFSVGSPQTAVGSVALAGV